MVYLMVAAFVSGVLYDVVWSLCVHSVARHRPLMAANTAVLTCLCTLFSTVLIVDGEWVPVVAFVAGSWVGTYSSVRWWTK